MIHNITRMLYTCFITVLFLSCINTARSLMTAILVDAGLSSLPLILFEINFIIGPFGMLFNEYFQKKLYFR